ncbi:23S rRNA (adenine(2503)-C(2))-methyltransferase RlmN [Tepidibacillus infernus]|uniref:Probable dual-specificity RNA methyltransferase RlmN n=1 Tax=Tepidibacillus decaturensis TaxID=1413211 RepID=A0A135L3X1_9BACI|nr:MULTISPECIES: 23S rRNA (adenine(2503)-C(2))-methyltransferase RlmN [Tepidibacillus]KXG43718.1 23S rRNA (adenine(2503)-C2)-methyltransferase [Tepidibacillus decaturensis]GBF12189.1 putative dual-specificity RNA methyltransferase RlmN [Tepidibacillus sp. HK-1]
MEKTNIYDLTFEEWENWLKENQEPAYRAKQIFDWLYVKRVDSIEQMTNLSKTLRQKLEDQFEFQALHTLNQHTSQDGTVKFLFQLYDGHAIETVIMRHDYGNSVCVTTQVGCKMGCTFCASTLGGVARNLTPGEIVAQVVESQKILDKEEGRVSSIVVMGSGEPFDNYEPTIQFIRIVNDNRGLNIGQRHITVSTSGIIPRIYDFANLKWQVGFAVSLHAPNDELRTRLMPINRKYPLKKLMEACHYYVNTTNRRITFEYALMGNVNDQDEHAEELANLIKDLKCHVNLIPVNHVPERDYVRTPRNQIFNFKKILEKHKVNVTIRREQGGDIEAACGQLRAKHIKHEFKL